MIINELYKTEITTTPLEVNKTNTVTVRIIDFNNNQISGKPVTLTCDKGKFTTSDSQIIEATTDASGKIDVEYLSDEVGMVTFQANNTVLQSVINGWKQITPTITEESGYDSNVTYSIRFYVNEFLKLAYLYISITSKEYDVATLQHFTINELSSSGAYKVAVPYVRANGGNTTYQGHLIDTGRFDTRFSASATGGANFFFVFPITLR